MTSIIKNSGIRNCDCAIYLSTLLVKLLSIALMTISTASLAQTAIAAEGIITPADASTTSISVENNNAIRQDLARIITIVSELKNCHIARGNKRTKYQYNLDANLYVCVSPKPRLAQ